MEWDAPREWPPEVRPPGSDGFEDSAVAWLLEVLPAGFRSHATLARHPVALASVARHITEGHVQGARAGFRVVHSELGEQVPPHVVDATLAAYKAEGRTLAAIARAAALVDAALRGELRPSHR